MNIEANQTDGKDIREMLKDYESQIATNIKELINVEEVYKLPYFSLIKILDLTEPLDTSTAKIIADNIKKNHSIYNSTEILPHIKLSNEKDRNYLYSNNDNQLYGKNNNNKIQIYIKLIIGKNVSILINPNATADDIKKIIQEKEGLDIDLQRLIFAGIQLEDGIPLSFYKIHNDSIIHLILRCRG